MDGYVRLVLTRTQLTPPSLVLNTPTTVPAYTVAGVNGSIARVTGKDVRPVLASAQFAPQLTLLKRPPLVPQYTVAGVTGSTARVLICEFVMPLKRNVQLPPPLTLLKSPLTVPPYTVAAVTRSIATAEPVRLVRPALTAAQLPPPLTLLNTPLAAVPTYTVAGVKGSIARTRVYGVVRPLLAGVQLPPPLPLLNTPPPFVPAYTVAGVTGSTARALTMPPFGPLLVQTLTPAEATPTARPREAMTTRIINRAFENAGIGNPLLTSVASGHCRNASESCSFHAIQKNEEFSSRYLSSGFRESLVKLPVELRKATELSPSGARPLGRRAARKATAYEILGGSILQESVPLVKFAHRACGKHVKCPVVGASEVSGLRSWAGMGFHAAGGADGALSGPGVGAGDEGTGSDSASDWGADQLDAGGGDYRVIGSDDAAMASAVRGAWVRRAF